MNHDDLRSRLARANPTPPSEPVDPITSDRARTLMEDIMATTIQTPKLSRRRMRLVAAVAAVLVVAIGALSMVNRGSDTPPLVLTAQGDALASCLPFDVELLRTMSPAFGGTVVELTDSVATVEVDRWYTGGYAEIVEIQYTPGFEALIGTPTLEVGQRYLITASDGVVNGCGFSGLATPELEAAFEQAFGA